ncbi:MAG TPA: DNA-binding transcriptional regulator [Pirellulales bacterium]|nr:DNA-binding transcriptional regulator [Pirellulales bacterium]
MSNERSVAGRVERVCADVSPAAYSRRPHVMLIVETALAYGRAVVQGISRYLIANQPWSLYVDLRELMAEPPDWLDNWRGDGVISRSTTPELADKLTRLGVPTVDLNDIYGKLGLPHVWTDHQAVGRLAAAHLLDRGFRNFAYCGFTGHHWSSLRRDGFGDELRRAGCDCRIFESPWETSKANSWEQQQDALGVWLAKLPKPVGVMCCNDLRGQQTLDACRRRELFVPEAVAVIGVDNDEVLCALCDPPLSSVVPNAERVGYEAAALLDRLMQGERSESSEILIAPRGIETRQSSDVLAIDDPLVAAAVKCIRERACRGLTVAEVLRQIPLSRSMLEKRFRRYLQQTPQEAIRSVQIKRVKQLLLETDLPLEAISRLAGFKHVEYMSVVFKRETSQTPGRFRRESQVS